jgi:asparagine synthase (glutamine-hydrolysing)
MLHDVRKLPPAHALTYDIQTGDSNVWRYWQLPAYAGPAEDADRSDPQLLDELEALLEDAVRRQMVADVPVGILLSGGVDSSLITAMAVRVAANVRTFTIRFPGHGRYDESEHARLIARHFKTEHAELDAADAGADLLPILAKQFDEPIVDSSMIPTFLVSQLIRQHCTVALGGDGGDELFAGYGHYDRLLWMQRRLGWVPKALRIGVSRSAERLLPIGFKGRNWLQGLGGELETGLPLIANYFDARSRVRLMTPMHHWSTHAERIRDDRIPRSGDMLQRATRMDFENYLAEDILVKVDRASMLNSLEVRAPLLDYRLIEFAFGRVPSRLKATGSERKILLKRLCSRVLPPEFDRQRKQGFSIPLGNWLAGGPWRDLFHDVLLGGDDTLFNRDFLRQLFDGQAKGRANSERLFALTMFELWRKEYHVSFD